MLGLQRLQRMGLLKGSRKRQAMFNLQKRILIYHPMRPKRQNMLMLSEPCARFRRLSFGTGAAELFYIIRLSR